MWYMQKIRNMCFATSVSCILSWSCGLFWEPFFPAESNDGNPKSEGSTRLVDSYDLCFFPFATSHPFREETRGKSPGLHQVGSIRYQASGSVIAIRPYGKISRSQPGNWKKGSNLSFTQLFLIFGVRLIEVSYICIVVLCCIYLFSEVFVAQTQWISQRESARFFCLPKYDLANRWSVTRLGLSRVCHFSSVGQSTAQTIIHVHLPLWIQTNGHVQWI